MTPAPVFLHHPSSLEHDTGAHPERAERIVAIDNELEGLGWLGFELVESPAVARDTLTAVHPERYVEFIERAAARGGGALDLDTRMSAGSFEAALHAAGGAVHLVDLLLDGAAPTGFQLAPAARPSRRAGKGDGLLPVQQHRRRRASRSRGARSRAGAHRRLGCPPWQRHQRHLPRLARGALPLDPPAGAVPGHRSGHRCGRRRPPPATR